MKRILEWLGRQSWIPAVAAPVDRAAFKLFGRGVSIGVPTLLLEHVGRKSGTTYQSPLFFLRDGDSYVVAGTNYGRDEPSWSRNLRSQPNVHVTVDRGRRPMRARIEEDSETAERYWREFGEMYSNYRDYRANADREIPLWVLDPV